MPSTIDHGTTRDGLIQLRRRWRPTGVARAAVLLLHGIAEHTGRYEHVGDRLAEHGFDVVGIDHRGFGQSGGRRAHVEEFSEFLDDVEDQLVEIRRLGVPTVILGHSMGGLIATAYCVDSGRPMPDLLVLSGPALGADVNPVLRTLAPLLSRVAPRMEIASDEDMSVLSTDLEVGEAFRDDPLRVPYATASLGHALLSTIEKTRASVHELTMPTYVLHGGDDTLVPTHASEILGEVDGVERVVFDGLRHEIFNEPSGLDIVDDVARWIDERL